MIKKRNSLKTRNDRVRLGPLNMAQLTDLAEKSSKLKDKAKIQRHINNRISRNK